MLNVRYGSSALSIPGIGIIIVGGCDKAGSISPSLNSVEMLIEDENADGGLRWIDFPSTLKKRYRPGIAIFQKSIIVAGGDMESSVEYYPLINNDQDGSQWSFIAGINMYNLKRISLVAFNDRLLLSKKHLNLIS